MAPRLTCPPRMHRLRTRTTVCQGRLETRWKATKPVEMGPFLSGWPWQAVGNLANDFSGDLLFRPLAVTGQEHDAHAFVQPMQIKRTEMRFAPEVAMYFRPLWSGRVM